VKSFISILLSLTLILNVSPAIAQEVNTLNSIDIVVPEEFGRIVKISGSPEEATPEKPFIIYMQDAHGNFEGQKNIINLTRFFQEKWLEPKARTTFFLEGLVGELDSNALKTTDDLKGLETFLMERMERGDIDAGSFLSTINPESFQFVALEEGSLYKANLITFQEALLQNKGALKRVKEYRSKVGSLLPKTLSDRAMEIQRSIESRLKRSDLIPEHLRLLKSTLLDVFVSEGGNDKKKIEDIFKKIFPSVDALLNLEAEARAVDQEKMGLELEILFPENTPQWSEKIRQELFSRYQTNPEDFKNTLNLKKYFAIELERQKIDATTLFQEIEKLESLVMRLVIFNQKEIKALNLFNKLNFLENFLILEIEKRDWEEVKNNPESFRSRKWLGELTALQGEAVAADYDPDIDLAYDRSRLFYHGTEKRDAIFIKKIRKHLGQNNDRVVFLVTGGFHKEALVDFFKKNSIPFALISPRLSQLEKGRETYLKGMKQLSLATISKPKMNDTQPVISKIDTEEARRINDRFQRAYAIGASLGRLDDVAFRSMIADHHGALIAMANTLKRHEVSQ